MDRSDPGAREERLYQVLLDYLESSERGPPPDVAELLRRHPEFAPELKDFLETQGQICDLTAPVRQVAQSLFRTARSGWPVTPGGGGAAPGAAVAAAPRSVGEYELLGEIGRGGMGVVYKARDRRLGRLVAVKMIRSAAHASPAEAARFLAEARAKALLDHPNIVPVYEVGEADGLPYLAMALVEGGSLQERLAAGPLPAGEAARLVRQVAEAIQHAHGRGVLHRDLKPHNVLLQMGNGERGMGSGGQAALHSPFPVPHSPLEACVPKVTDFGLARLAGQEGLTATGEVLGTPGYMPPEQAGGRAQDVGPHSDVYSLGAVLYCLLTGRPPFQAAGVAETLRLVREQEPVPPRRLNPAVPRDLETVCLKCLEKNPRRRYATAAGLAQELARFERGEPVLAAPAGPLTHAAKWMRRRPAIAGLLATSVFLAVAGLASFAWAYSAARREAGRARRETERADAEAAGARLQAREALLGLYASQIGRARAELLANDHPAAARVLAQTRPDLRGWEYGHLLRCSEGTPCVLRSPGGRVHAVAFSPDGARLVTGSADGAARVWDTRTGRELLTLPGHGGEVSSVAFGPTGADLATASRDGTARVWDGRTAESLRVLRGHTNSVNAVCYDPGGARLATASDDRTVRVWDARSGRQLLNLDTPDGAANAAAFSPAGDRLAASSGDGGVHVWDARTGAPLLAFGARGARAVAFSPTAPGWRRRPPTAWRCGTGAPGGNSSSSAAPPPRTRWLTARTRPASRPRTRTARCGCGTPAPGPS
jgi:serine/threonine protein kinase